MHDVKINHSAARPLYFLDWPLAPTITESRDQHSSSRNRSFRCSHILKADSVTSRLLLLFSYLEAAMTMTLDSENAPNGYILKFKH